MYKHAKITNGFHSMGVSSSHFHGPNIHISSKRIVPGVIYTQMVRGRLYVLQRNRYVLINQGCVVRSSLFKWASVLV
jgi:hypothetical protein